MSELTVQAFQAIQVMAAQVVPALEILRLTYVDDEGDHCTLSAETITDALSFAESCPEEGIRRLTLRIATAPAMEEEAPAGEAAPDAAAAPPPQTKADEEEQ